MKREREKNKERALPEKEGRGSLYDSVDGCPHTHTHPVRKEPLGGIERGKETGTKGLFSPFFFLSRPPDKCAGEGG